MDKPPKGYKRCRRAKNTRMYNMVTAPSIRRDNKYQQVDMAEYDPANIAIIRFGLQR